MKKKNVKSFSTRWGFILASVGSAVGMANVWGFPNKMGSNGGGAFLLIYILFVLIFSYVGLPAEFAMGRRAATGTLGAYENAWATRGKGADAAHRVAGDLLHALVREHARLLVEAGLELRVVDARVARADDQRAAPAHRKGQGLGDAR